MPETSDPITRFHNDPTTANLLRATTATFTFTLIETYGAISEAYHLRTSYFVRLLFITVRIFAAMLPLVVLWGLAFAIGSILGLLVRALLCAVGPLFVKFVN